MAEPTGTKEALRRVLEDAEARLEGVEHTPYSDAAFAALKQSISQYVSDLVSESIRVARRGRADAVSAADVREASQYLGSGLGRPASKLLLTVGGTLVGASVSAVLAIIATGEYSTVGFAVFFGVGIVGAFMLAFGIARE